MDVVRWVGPPLTFFQGHIQITPLTWNLTSNTPLEKENHLPVPIIFKFYVKLQGHIQIIRHDKTRLQPHLLGQDFAEFNTPPEGITSDFSRRRGNFPMFLEGFPKDSFCDWMIFLLFEKTSTKKKCTLKDEVKMIFNELILEHTTITLNW